MAEKSKKKDGGQRYDWEKVKIWYVTTPGSSIKKTAEKFGIRLATVSKKCSADNWFATKKEYHKEMSNNVIEKVRSIREDNLAKEVVAADMFADAIVKLLSDPEQFYRYMNVNIMTGEAKEEIGGKADTRSMKDAMSVLKMVEELKRSVIGIQKIDAIQKHEIEQERLQLERERFEFEKQKAEYMKPDTSNAIRIEGFEEGWDE